MRLGIWCRVAPPPHEGVTLENAPTISPEGGGNGEDYCEE